MEKTRHIVLICHNLRGIIANKAILLHQSSKEGKAIRNSIVVIMFMSIGRNDGMTNRRVAELPKWRIEEELAMWWCDEIWLRWEKIQVHFDKEFTDGADMFTIRFHWSTCSFASWFKKSTGGIFSFQRCRFRSYLVHLPLFLSITCYRQMIYWLNCHLNGLSSQISKGKATKRDSASVWIT